jgi:putative FmdB family regulatory protein
MPLYEFECRSCGAHFEELVRGSESVSCPKCEGTRLEKLLSVPARPVSSGTELPSACASTGPPCGPMCSRFKSE